MRLGDKQKRAEGSFSDPSLLAQDDIFNFSVRILYKMVDQTDQYAESVLNPRLTLLEIIKSSES